MDPATASVFEALRAEDSLNNFCLECGAHNPQWCALSYGSFICMNCSGQHRSLGVHLSFVRSSNMDSWTPPQLALMKNGGNTKCREFFESQNVWNMPLKQRYATKAAAYYRAHLRALADQGTQPEPLQDGEGQEPDPNNFSRSSSKGSTSDIRSMGSTSVDAQGESFISRIQQQAAAAGAAAAAAAASVSTNFTSADEDGTGTGVMEAAFQSMSSFARDAKEYTAKQLEGGDGSIYEKAKESFQTGGEWISEAGKKIASSISGAMEEKPQTGTPEPAGADGNGQGVFNKMGSIMSSARSYTSKGIAAVVGEGNESDEGVIGKAKEGWSSLTSAAATWLQPVVPPPDLPGEATEGIGVAGEATNTSADT